MKNLSFAAALLCLPTFAFADGIEITEAYSPLAAPGAMASAAYMVITNTGDVPREITGVAAMGYKMAHLHQSMEQDGVASMAPVAQITIAPGQSVTFAPGGYHVMLMHTMTPAAAGDEIEITVTFANGESVPVAAIVQDGSYEDS